MKRYKILMWMSVVVLGLCMLIGCNQKEEIKTLHIAALNGPTGMGMVQLLEDTSGNYDITLYQSADEVVAKIISKEIDIACVPSNLGSVLYNKTEGEIKLLGINTLGVLYVVENGNTITSMQDLEGKTIVSSGKGGTPEYVLSKLLQESGLEEGVNVEVEYLANHTDVVAKVTTEPGTIALLPEPHVTVACSNAPEVQVAIDINEVWKTETGSDLPMGIVIAQKELITESDNEATLEKFLNAYSASVDFVNSQPEEAAQLIENHGILAKKAIAQKAIGSCQIVFMTGEEAKVALESFYSILADFNPQAVGGQLPDEAFYHKR